MKFFHNASLLWVLMLWLPCSSFGQAILNEVLGRQAQDNLGLSLAPMGDVNGDGIRDFATYYRGDTLVYSGATFVSLFSIPQPLPRGVIPDVDGDGQGDWAFLDTGVGTNRRISAVSSATHSVLWTATGLNPGLSFGTNVISAEDLDGDGVHDLLVSEHTWPGGNNPNFPRGRIHVVSGATGNLISTITAPDSEPRDFAYSMDRVNDIDNDGFDDFVIGSPQQYYWQMGFAEIYSGQTGQLLESLPRGPGLWTQWGASVANVGDVNGDGITDIGVGSVGHDDDPGGPYPQGVRIFSGADRSVLIEITGEVGERFGRKLTPAGDQDGDGAADFIISSDRRQILVSGGTGTFLFVQSPNIDGLGTLVCAGDLNGDGFEDLFEGFPDTSINGFASGRIRAISGGYQDLASTPYCQSTVNSSGMPAELTATGLPGATANNFALRLSQAPRNEAGYFLTSRGQDLVLNPGGSHGTLCLGGGQGIARLHDTFVGDMQYGNHDAVVDLQSIPEPPHFHGTVLSGERWNFQAWFRDGNSSNFSSAVSVVFQ